MKTFSEKELQEIRQIYQKDLSELNPENFDQLHKQLRLKYHPDKFEQYEDDVVREMANEKFKRLEELGGKIKEYLANGGAGTVEPVEDIFKENARFAYDNMKIEIITRDKDLKYKLFGTRYRWLMKGDKFKVPQTEKAYIIIDADHAGRKIGFNESIRMYLTFGEQDSLDAIATWLYQRIVGYSDGLIIAGKRIDVDLAQMQARIRRKSFLRLEG